MWPEILAMLYSPKDLCLFLGFLTGFAKLWTSPQYSCHLPFSLQGLSIWEKKPKRKKTKTKKNPKNNQEKN